MLFTANLFAQRTITVTGAGTSGVNVVYTEDGTEQGKPHFFHVAVHLVGLQGIKYAGGQVGVGFGLYKVQVP